MRHFLAAVVVAGCGFEHGWVDAPSDDPGDSIPPDADPSSPRTCKQPDSELRLCIEFEDGVVSPKVSDASMYQSDADAKNVIAALRDNTPAVATYAESEIRIPETSNLDIHPAITLELWVRPAFTQRKPLIANDGQYRLTYEDGRVTCAIGSVATATSDSFAIGTWSHVACTFDGEALRVYVNGDPHRCMYQRTDIPIAGTQGTQIATGFAGGVDDLHVYARALSPAEICANAGRTQCSNSCSGGGWSGGDGEG